MPEARIVEFLEDCPKHVKVISGHHIRPLSSSNTQKYGLVYSTFIRHPIERIISLYHYEKKHSSQRPDSYGENHCSQKPFDEYVEIRMTEDNALSNWQVYDLTGGFSADLAIDLLNDFLFIGVVEEFDKSLLLLGDIMLKRKILRSFYTGYIRLNTASASELERADLSSAMLERLLTMNQEDLKLFNYARHKLNLELENIKHLKLKQCSHYIRCVGYSWRKKVVGWTQEPRLHINSFLRRVFNL